MKLGHFISVNKMVSVRKKTYKISVKLYTRIGKNYISLPHEDKKTYPIHSASAY